MTFPALLAHSSPPLRLWRVVGVALMVTQAVYDVRTYRDAKRATRIAATCVAPRAPSHVDGVHCNLARTRQPFKAPRQHPERLHDATLKDNAEFLGNVVWWFLLGDIIVHLITGRRVKKDKDLKPLCYAYIKSKWIHIDIGLLMPGLVEFLFKELLKVTGLDHPLLFIYNHVHIIPPHRRFRPGRYIRKALFALIKFSMHHRRLVRGLVAEAETVLKVSEVARTVAREAEVAAEVYEQGRDAATPRGSLRLRISPGAGDRRGSFSLDGALRSPK